MKSDFRSWRSARVLMDRLRRIQQVSWGGWVKSLFLWWKMGLSLVANVSRLAWESSKRRKNSLIMLSWLIWRFLFSRVEDYLASNLLDSSKTNIFTLQSQAETSKSLRLWVNVKEEHVFVMKIGTGNSIWKTFAIESTSCHSACEKDFF